MSIRTFSIAGLSTESGTRSAQVLDLTFAGVSTKFPLFVLCGEQSGPTVVITAGIHGAEYVGIEAAMRLAKVTNVAELRGTLVIAPVSSMTSFAKRAIYLAPPDNKNLNRCFPGQSDGSFAEQLANWIFENLIKRADAYLDLHGGDLNEALELFSIISITGNAALDDRSMQLAAAFGLPSIITSEVKGSTISAAGRAGIPAVLAEVGGQGMWPETDVQLMVDGLHGALASIGMVTLTLERKPTRIMEQMNWLRSENDGMFYPKCKVGETVVKGQIVGSITDYLGNPVQTATAPIDGTVMFLVTTLAINKGDPLLSVGA